MLHFVRNDTLPCTRNAGRFKECFPGGKFSHRWTSRKIDSRTAKKANKDQIEKWIADYGPESDFIKVRVRGEFPSSSVSQFIGEDLIEEAMKRELILEAYYSSPVVFGVDVARFGDDASVILVRQGVAILGIRKYREVNTVQLSGYVVEAIKKYNPQTVFIDVVGIGAGVVDQLLSTWPPFFLMPSDRVTKKRIDFSSPRLPLRLINHQATKEVRF